MPKLPIALLALLLVAPPDAFARCGPSRLSGGTTKPQVITLNALARGVRDAPAFYMQLPEKRALLYFKPEDVVEQLKKSSAHYLSELAPSASKITDAYLAVISRDLPLKENTDLFKYVLDNNDFESRQEFLVSELLKEGQAYIDSAPFRDATRNPGDDLNDRKTLVMVSKMGYGEEWRLFCEPLRVDENPKYTREFLFVTYVIVD